MVNYDKHSYVVALKDDDTMERYKCGEWFKVESCTDNLLELKSLVSFKIITDAPITDFYPLYATFIPPYQPIETFPPSWQPVITSTTTGSVILNNAINNEIEIDINKLLSCDYQINNDIRVSIGIYELDTEESNCYFTIANDEDTLALDLSKQELNEFIKLLKIFYNQL